MGKITERIKEGYTLLSDGAWGTFLQAKGLKPGECPEMMNLTHPDVVFGIARAYIEAGSNMVETNSFGGSSIKLRHYNLQDKAYELNKQAALISKKAAGTHHFVLGSIGPTGKILMMGDITEEELYRSFAEQARALAEGGADALIIETMTDLDEARIAVSAASDNTDLEIFCTMTFEKTKIGEFRTMMGVSPTDMVKKIVPEGASVIGANCGNGIKDMIGIVKEIRGVDKDIPILVHANAGIPVYLDGKTVFPETPTEMASYIQEIVLAGANIIGGCCGTTPDHIACIHKKIGEMH